MEVLAGNYTVGGYYIALSAVGLLWREDVRSQGGRNTEPTLCTFRATISECGLFPCRHGRDAFGVVY